MKQYDKIGKALKNQKRNGIYEAYQNAQYKISAEYTEKGRLRRVPDILPVCLQDFLHRRKPDLRKQ